MLVGILGVVYVELPSYRVPYSSDLCYDVFHLIFFSLLTIHRRPDMVFAFCIPFPISTSPIRSRNSVSAKYIHLCYRDHQTVTSIER